MKTIFRLIFFVRKRWALLLLGFICITVSTVGGLVIPRVLGNGIDTVISSGSRSTLITLALIILGTTVLRSAARFGDTGDANGLQGVSCARGVGHQDASLRDVLQDVLFL